MARSSDNNQYGRGALTIANLTGSRTVTVTHPGGTTWPNSHIAGTDVTFTVATTTGGTLPPDGQWGLAIMTDGADAGGNYTVGGDVIAYAALGAGTSLPSSIAVTGLSGRGTYRFVVMAGDTAARAQNSTGTDTGPTSGQYHIDADGAEVRGTLVGTPTKGTAIVGIAGRLTDADSLAPSLALARYGDLLSITGSLDGTMMRSDRQIKVALSTDAAGSTVQDIVHRPTVAANGDISITGIPIDTDFGQVLGGTPLYLQMAVNNELGDSTTPSGELASDYALGTPLGTTTAQRSFFIFSRTQLPARFDGGDGTASVQVASFDGGDGTATTLGCSFDGNIS